MKTEEIIKFLTDQKEYTAVIKLQDKIIRDLTAPKLSGSTYMVSNMGPGQPLKFGWAGNPDW